MNRGEVTCILLDLYAAFDTVEVSPQSTKNWISCYWHKTTMSQICWSYKLISQQWYHPSQFLCSLSAFSALLSWYGLFCADGTLNPIHSLILCSQSWFHVWLWHVFLWLNQLCIWILSFLHSSSFSFFCSDSFCEFTSSKLDYCNSLYFGISQAILNKLQRIQNPLASVIVNTSKYQYITPLLKKLHWLPIKQRIHYKICLLTYKTLTNQQPT